MTGNDELVRILSGDDPLSAPISAADRELLIYAIKLTREPGGVGAGDVESLRAAGFDDRAIHDACQVVAYFGYVNRVADGLGVELEAEDNSG